MTNTIQITYKGQTKPFYYVRLGALLEYIQNHLMYIVQIDENNNSPLLKFDTEVETNLMFIENLQVSVDPNICLINRTLTDLSGNEFNFTNHDQQFADPFESSLFTGYNCYGQVMNIYIHMKWILLKLDELKDANTGKVVLIDFLNGILSSVNSALGGINALEATVDEVTNTVIIRDRNPLPNMDLVISTLNTFYKNNNSNKKLSNKSVIFDLYGYNTDQPNLYNKAGHASFIKDFSFTTEITPQLSTMLTVGATANGEVVGENSTAFSRFNTGLTDRFKTQISLPSAMNTSSPDVLSTPALSYVGGLVKNITDSIDSNTEKIDDLDEEQKALVVKYAGTYSRYIEYVRNLAAPTFTFNNEEANTYKNTVVNFNTYLQQIRQIAVRKVELEKNISIKSFLPGTGFIPFNMSITMDGMSGMKIYNKFNINTEYLPTNYPANAEFLIKNITHKIENNKWNTTLESIITVKGDYKSKSGNNLPGKSTDGKSSSTPINRDRCTIKVRPTGVKKVSKKEFINFFKARKYSNVTIAAILGNIISESGLNLNAANDLEGGCGTYGLAQWRSDRQTKLFNYAKSIGQPLDSAAAQLGFIHKEIEESKYANEFKSQLNVKEASFIFSEEFERFNGSSNRSNPEVIKRQNVAQGQLSFEGFFLESGQILKLD